MDTTDIEYYGQCEHLDCMDIEDDKCLKRYFLINDYKQLKHYRLAICNDYLKLLIHEKVVKQNWSYRRDVEEVLTNLIKDHTGVEGLDNRGWHDKFQITLPVCERPFIYKYCNFFEALEMLVESSKSYDWILTYNVSDSIISAFKGIKDYMKKYSKYKSSWASLNRIEKKLKRIHYASDIDKINILTEIMDLMIKYKINKL